MTVEQEEFANKIGTTYLIEKDDFLDFFYAFLLPKPGLKLNVHHHGVDSEIINGEIATYIKYPEPEKEPWEKLKEDFKIAQHLKPLLELDQENIDKDVILIRAPDQYTAYIALKYATAKVRSIYDSEQGLQWYEVVEDDEEENSEFSFETKMPIISLQEIERYFLNLAGESLNPIFNNFQGNDNVKKSPPYYLKNRRSPLCTTINSKDYNMNLLRKLEKLKGRSHLTLLIYPFGNKIENIFGDGIAHNEVISELEFFYAREAINIGKPEIGDGYYEKIFSDYTHDLGCKLDPSVNILELLSTIKRSRKEMNATVIEKSILNAYRRSGKKHVLGMEDFYFLDAKSKVSVQEPGLSAEQELHKLIIGQDEVKKQILDALACYKMNAIRTQAGLPDSRLHKIFAFIGASGTAKTTAAHIMGKMMVEEQLLPGATHLLASGKVDIKTIAARLGHKNAAMTLNIYSHVLPVKQREAASVMAHLWT